LIAASWSDVLSNLAPLALLVLFWVFLMARVRGKGASALHEIQERLAEAEDEIKRLRRRVDFLESSAR
jgi:cell division protein FtsB